MTHLKANSHMRNILYITGTFNWLFLAYLIDASISPTVCC